MTSINYPTKETFKTLERIKSSSLKLTIVKLKTIKNKKNLLHSFLNSVCKEYQNEKDEMKRMKIVNVFANQVSDYIISDSEEHKNIIYNRIKKISLNSDLNDKFSISLINPDKNIFNAVIVKKNIDEEFVNLNIAYKLFSTKTLEKFKPTSRIFSILNEKLLTDMLNQRFIIKNYEEKIKNMKKELDQDESLKHKIEKLSEIIYYNNDKLNNLEPINYLESLEEKDLINENLLHLFSCMFNINIFICRMWNNDLTVIKEINFSKESHSILLFKYFGKVSLTGMETNVFYETGGIEINGKIMTILNCDEHEKIIKKLRREINCGKEKFLMEKYNNYLDNLEKSEHLDNMETNYDNNISDDNTEFLELDNSDKQLTNINKPIENIKVIEITLEKNNILPDNQYQAPIEDIDIPYFIRDLTDNELRDLYHKFINSETNLEGISRKNLEIQYKNFIHQNNKNISDIIQNLKEKTVKKKYEQNRKI